MQTADEVVPRTRKEIKPTPADDSKTCKCGCGVSVQERQKYAHGHNRKGIKQSSAQITKRRDAIKQAWQDKSKYQAMRNQSPELVERRIHMRRGSKLSKEHCANISKANRGRKLTPEQKAKIDLTRLDVRNLSPEAEARRRQSISEKRKGCHGFGRASRGRLDHHRALHWVVRDPMMVIHEFNNLWEWCRVNEWRFLPDDRPNSKLPLWRRAVGGFNNQSRTDRKGCHHWRGWQLVSSLEQGMNGVPSLMTV